MKLIGINWEQTLQLIDSRWHYQGVHFKERFSGVKNDERYPKKAIDYLLSEYNLKRDR